MSDIDNRLYVDGTAHFKESITTDSTINGVTLTSQGEADQFLSADGTYKNIDITGMQNKINELESIIKELKEKLS
ncbi:MAG: hypothetical protein LUE93_01670 [Bacteroides sp.]|nr:hypothetical protein [Bacteroides sp.]